MISPVIGGWKLRMRIALLQILHLAAHQLEIGQIAFDLGVDARSDVGFAQDHQLLHVVARLEQQTPHGRVRDQIFGEDDRPQVEEDQLLHDFMCSLSGSFSWRKIAGTIFDPRTSWPWKVQPVRGS